VVVVQVFLLAPVRVVDAAVQRQLRGSALNLAERRLVQQRNRILIQLAPAHRVQVAKQAHALLVPTPPHVARQLPKFFLCRGNEAIECPRLAHHRRHLARRFRQHANFFFAKNARFFGLHDQHALQHAAVDQRHAEKGVVLVFARFLEVLVAGMLGRIGHGHRKQPLGHQAGKAFMQRHAQAADAFWMQAQRGGKHQVRAVGFQQVRRTDVGLEALGDQRHHVHQRLRRLALLLRQVRNLFQRQDKVGVSGCVGRRVHGFILASRS